MRERTLTVMNLLQSIAPNPGARARTQYTEQGINEYCSMSE